MKHNNTHRVLTEAGCSYLESCDVCDHVGEKSVAGNVERHPEAHVTRALVQLTWQLAVAHVELTQGVAGGQRHEGQVCNNIRQIENAGTSLVTDLKSSSVCSCVTFWVPGAHDDPSVLWVLLDGVDDLLQLVNSLSRVICWKKMILDMRYSNLVHPCQESLFLLEGFSILFA